MEFSLSNVRTLGFHCLGLILQVFMRVFPAYGEILLIRIRVHKNQRQSNNRRMYFTVISGILNGLIICGSNDQH